MNTLKDDEVLRKYMSLSKLMFLLQNRKLYFSRADLTRNYKESKFLRTTEGYNFYYGSEKTIAELSPQIKLKTAFLVNTDEIAKFIYVNSWNYGDSESNALWQIFTLKDECIILETSKERFKQSVNEKLELLIEKVKYEDIKPDSTKIITSRNYYAPFFIKDKFFEHEKEARILLSTFNESIPGEKIDPVVNKIGELIGFYMSVDLSTLVNNIIVFPDAEDFAVKTIQSLIHKYLPDCKVVKSSLDRNEFRQVIGVIE